MSDVILPLLFSGDPKTLIFSIGVAKTGVTIDLSIEKIYELRCMIIDDPVAGTPQVVPLGRR